MYTISMLLDIMYTISMLLDIMYTISMLLAASFLTDLWPRVFAHHRLSPSFSQPSFPSFIHSFLLPSVIYFSSRSFRLSSFHSFTYPFIPSSIHPSHLSSVHLLSRDLSIHSSVCSTIPFGPFRSPVSPSIPFPPSVLSCFKSFVFCLRKAFH